MQSKPYGLGLLALGILFFGGQLVLYIGHKITPPSPPHPHTAFMLRRDESLLGIFGAALLVGGVVALAAGHHSEH